MKDNPSGAEPRYKYAKPTEKPQFGKANQPSNEGSTLSAHIAAYKLPAIDVDTARRNFPGYTESQCYTLDDMRMGDISGTTETDSDTDKGSGGYTKIYSRAKSPTPGTRR